MADDWFPKLYDSIMGRSMYFDKQGKPISAERMAELKWGPFIDGDETGISDYGRIGWDVVRDLEVSTVWLGIDHGWGYSTDPDNYRPVLFETMVFGGDGDNYCERYHTEEEAITGHRRVVESLHAGQDLEQI